MHSQRKRFLNWLNEEEGATAVEYAMMLAMIVIVCVVAIYTLGSTANAVFNAPKISNALTGS